MIAIARGAWRAAYSKRDRTPVAVAHEQRRRNAEVLEQCRQNVPRLSMQVVGGARPLERRGAAVAAA
jgi:hypothetical protein